MIPWVVAQNTIKEILRDRILYGLLIFAFFMVLLSILLGNLSFSEQARIVTNMGLVAAQLGCGMLATFIGSSVVWRELEKQTVLTLLSKPVSRTSFILGKFLGLGTVILTVDILVSGFLGLICLNFGQVDWIAFVWAQVGVLLESFLLVAMALFFGVFCRPTLTTIFTLSFWIIGHTVGDIAYFSSKSESSFTQSLGGIISRIFPDLSVFNFREAVVYGDSIPFQSILGAFQLFTGWVLILGVATIWIFRKRDFT